VLSAKTADDAKQVWFVNDIFAEGPLQGVENGGIT